MSGLRQLAGDLLHTDRELFLTQVDQVGLEFVSRLFTESFDIHQRTVRVTKVVVTESLAAARRNASRATSSETPSIS